MLFLVASGEVKPGIGVLGGLLIIFPVAVGFFQYSFGLNSGRRAQRLDTALREVQRNLKLPVMD
jgi:hypothetical protein